MPAYLPRFCAPLPTPPFTRTLSFVNPLGTTPAPNGWRAIAYSPSLGRLVAAAIAGTVVTRSDNAGDSWTNGTIAARAWESIAWSPALNLFAAVCIGGGAAGQVSTSSDGITWTARTSAFDANWRAVVWSARLNKFFAVADTAVDAFPSAMESANGVNWTAINLLGRRFLALLEIPETNSFLAGGAPAIGTPTPLAVSGNGQNWTLFPQPPAIAAESLDVRGIAYSPRLNMVVMSRSVQTRFIISRGWLNFDLSNPVPTGNWIRIFWCDPLRLFIAFDAGTAPATQKAIISRDGINWEYVTTASTMAAYTAALFVPELGLAIAMLQNNVLLSSAQMVFDRPD